MSTSKLEHIIDASEETGHIFTFIKYQIDDNLNNTLVYTLHFASREFMRNIRTKISQAYDGKVSSIVQEILGDKDGLIVEKSYTMKKLKIQINL